MHRLTQFTISVGPEHEMEVVRHQTPSQNPHRQASASPFDQLYERPIVVDLMKDLLARIA